MGLRHHRIHNVQTSQEVHKSLIDFGRSLDGHPVPAFFQHNDLYIAEFGNYRLRDAWRTDRIVLAGNKQNWTFDAREIRRNCLGYRFARARVTFRRLAQHQLTGEWRNQRVLQRMLRILRQTRHCRQSLPIRLVGPLPRDHARPAGARPPVRG